MGSVKTQNSLWLDMNPVWLDWADVQADLSLFRQAAQVTLLV